MHLADPLEHPGKLIFEQQQFVWWVALKKKKNVMVA